MRLTSAWIPRLAAPRTRKVILCTIAWGKPSAPAGIDHIAREPGSLRAATESAHVPDGSSAIPFWPVIQSWPEIRLRWSPVDRRAETADVTLDLLGSADVQERIRDAGEQPVGWGRLDLWTDGVELDEVVPLIEGPVTVEHQDRYAEGGARLRFTDGEVNREVLFPPGPLALDEFPDAPENVAGTANRQVILGGFPRRVPAYQIDKEARKFYLCEPPVSSPPTEFFIGADAVDPSAAPRVTVGTGAASGFAYTLLEFGEPVFQGRSTGRVSCSGGIGFAPQSPLRDLIEAYGGYAVTPGAQAALDALSLRTFPSLSVFANQQQPILAIAADRLLPQTDLVFAWRMGAVDVIRLHDSASETRLGIGTGLLLRLEEDTPWTPAESVWNAFEIRYGRDVSGGSTATATGEEKVSLDRSFGGSIGALLSASENRYGRRFLKIDANDLQNEADALDLGKSWARANAFAHERRRYLCAWSLGMALDRNARVIATDDDWDDVPTRVVEWFLSQSGPVVVLETEDLELREGVRG